MKYEKQKKIRKILIKYCNEQIHLHRKGENLLINSTTLEELEQKNYKFKEFCVREPTQTYQNVDNNRSIIENIFINNKLTSDIIVIYPLLTEREKPLKTKLKLNLNNFNNKTSSFVDSKLDKTFIENNRFFDSKVITSQNTKNIQSPVHKRTLIKKELFQRKIKNSKKEIYANSFSKNQLIQLNKVESSKSGSKKNLSEGLNVDVGHSRQLSTETLATQISKIIKISNNEKNINSHELRDRSSKIENENIQIAKKYAKKLKNYCRTLKNKLAKKGNKNKTKTIEHKANEKNAILENSKKNQENRKHYKRLKTKKSDKEKEKEKTRNKQKLTKLMRNHPINLDNIILQKGLSPRKTLKTDRIMKHKIERNGFDYSDENLNSEQSTNILYKTIENETNVRNSKGTVKIKKILTEKIKVKNKVKAEEKEKKGSINGKLLATKLKNNKKMSIDNRLDAIKKSKKLLKNYNLQNNEKDDTIDASEKKMCTPPDNKINYKISTSEKVLIRNLKNRGGAKSKTFFNQKDNKKIHPTLKRLKLRKGMEIKEIEKEDD